MRHRIAIIYLLIALLGSGCYDRHNEPGGNDSALRATTSIAKLRELSLNGYTLVESDIVCAGRITTSDKEGNFYRTIFIEDDTAAAELLLGIYQSHTSYPEGLQVAVHLRGCAMAMQDGILRIGLPADAHDSTHSPREFESQVMLDRHIVRGSDITPIVTPTYDIAQLNTDLCGRLIRIEGVHHKPLVEQECSNISGYHRFIDDNNLSIYCSVSEYADFADMAIPEVDTAILGILSYEHISKAEGYRYVLRPRSASDLLDGAQHLDE